jgi:hypothetical protein
MLEWKAGDMFANFPLPSLIPNGRHPDSFKEII